ncbi:MAG TPA: hypothetical protein VFV54_08590 [Thermoanaerobaculia bacterium]|nr:hypothetical protein [Thermoanaerobaculia bacterium]
MNVLPPSFDNTYRGHRLALWILGVVVVMKILMSVNSILNGRYVARKADGLPLDSYPAGAAGTILSFLALWALGHLLLSLLGVLALVRYRSMVPFVFALLLTEHLGRKLIIQFLPMARSVSGPASAINLALVALMIAGLVLSLWRRTDPPTRGARATTPS